MIWKNFYFFFSSGARKRETADSPSASCFEIVALRKAAWQPREMKEVRRGSRASFCERGARHPVFCDSPESERIPTECHVVQ